MTQAQMPPNEREQFGRMLRRAIPLPKHDREEQDERKLLRRIEIRSAVK
jgi:hypothetical protein